MIDQNTCLNCGMCATVCPRHVIVDRRGIVANYRYFNFIRQKTKTDRNTQGASVGFSFYVLGDSKS